MPKKTASKNRRSVTPAAHHRAYLTFNETERLLAAAATPQERALLHFAIENGQRVGEVLRDGFADEQAALSAALEPSADESASEAADGDRTDSDE